MYTNVHLFRNDNIELVLWQCPRYNNSNSVRKRIFPSTVKFSKHIIYYFYFLFSIISYIKHINMY